MSVALFVGRFQPFHNGHLLAIEEILKENEKVVIVIGSAGQKNTYENPFSLEEREEMIRASLSARGIKDFEIRNVRDFNDDKLWTQAVKRVCRFDTVYSQNPWTLECFEKNKIRTKRHNLYNEKEYNGTQIRKMIAGGEEWKDLVPSEVYGYMKRKGGEERIRKLSRNSKA